MSFLNHLVIIDDVIEEKWWQMKRLDMFKAHARAQWNEIFFVLALLLKFKYCAKAKKFESIFHLFSDIFQIQIFDAF